jgi:hypothetical protein
VRAGVIHPEVGLALARREDIVRTSDAASKEQAAELSPLHRRPSNPPQEGPTQLPRQRCHSRSFRRLRRLRCAQCRIPSRRNRDRYRARCPPRGRTGRRPGKYVLRQHWRCRRARGHRESVRRRAWRRDHAHRALAQEEVRSHPARTSRSPVPGALQPQQSHPTGRPAKRPLCQGRPRCCSPGTQGALRRERPSSS